MTNEEGLFFTTEQRRHGYGHHDFQISISTSGELFFGGHALALFLKFTCITSTVLWVCFTQASFLSQCFFEMCMLMFD